MTAATFRITALSPGRTNTNGWVSKTYVQAMEVGFGVYGYSGDPEILRKRR
jgi:hypothetical protein